jgi:diguanylate cyclase
MSLLSRLRDRRSRAQLVEELEQARARGAALEQLAIAMLGSARALVLDLEELGAPAVQAALGDTIERLRAGLAGPELEEATTLRQQETLEFAQLERQYLDRRDAELRRMVQVLVDGLAQVAAGSATYHRRLMDNGARLEAAARLDDLVRMRAAIASEVAQLRRAVAERQSEEATASAAMRDELDQLRARMQQVQHAARTDALTGAANRAAFDDALLRAVVQAAGGGQRFALLMVDVDHFKQLNDTHGHPVGDRVLRSLAAFLRDELRHDDLLARWGGEEFAVILPGASARGAFAKARALVKALANHGWSFEGGSLLRITVSVGVAAWQGGDTAESLVERADRALYEAKRGGRNRAVRG